MDKNKCRVGEKVIYSPPNQPEKLEIGVVTELRDRHAMVLYEGDNISKATYYLDLQ